MNNNTVLTIAVLGAVAVAGYLLYQHYNQNTATVHSNGVSATVNLGGLISDIGGLFGNNQNS